MSAIGSVLKSAAKDMAEGGEKAGKSIAQHFEDIGKTLEKSGTKYKNLESDLEKNITDVGKNTAKDVDKSAGAIGKDAEKSAQSSAVTAEGDAAAAAGKTAAKSVGSEAAASEKLAANDAEREAKDAQVPGAQGASKDPVDLVSGEMFLSQRDIGLDGTLVLILERMHRSGYPHGRLFGRTWASTLDQRVEIDDDGVHYAAPDGTILHYAVPAQPGVKVLPNLGARWPLSYDESADAYRIEQPEAGRTLHFGLPEAEPDDGRRVRALGAVTDRNGNRITVIRDADGLPTDVYHSGGYHIEVRSALTREGARIGEYLLADPHTRTSTSLVRFGYDMAGRLTEVFNSSGEPLRYEYDAADRITAWVDRNGFRYEYHYDEGTGRVERAVGADGLLSASFEYDLAARETVLTDSTGQRELYRYNERGQLLEVVDALGGVVRTEHDEHNRLLSRTDQLGRTTRIEWSGHGDPVRVEHPDGTVTLAEYAAPRQVQRVTQADGGVWQYAYDERGNVVAATDPAGASTHFVFDERGALASVTGRSGEVRRFENDARGLPVAETDALGATTTITRDAFGRPVAATDPLGNTYRREWSVEGYPTRREMPDGSFETWAYDAESNMLRFQDAAGHVTAFEYGGFDLVSTRVDPDGSRYAFAYDTELRLTQVTGPTGLDWQYKYDVRGRVVGERDFNGREVGYRLDAAGQLVERTCAGGENTVFQHDAAGRVIGRTVGANAYTYAFDQTGQLIRAEGPDGVLELTRDQLGRVLSETFDGRVSHSSYDATGHQIGRVTATGAHSAWSFDAAGRAARLTAGAGGFEFHRDAAGRETGRVLGPGAALSQSFDALGRLSAQAIWARDEQIAEGDGYQDIQVRTYVYRADGFPLEVADRLGGDAHYQLDQLGRVTAVHAANWHESYAYDALGNLAAAADPETATAAAGAGAAAEPFELQGTLVRQTGRTRYEHDARGRIVRSTRRTLSGQTRESTYVWDDEDLLREVHTADGATWRYRYDPLGRRVAKQRIAADGAVEAETAFSWEGSRLAEEYSRRPDGTITALTWDYQPNSFTPTAQRRRTWVDGASAEQISEEFFAIVADAAGTPRELVTLDGRVAWRQAEGLWGPAAAAANSDVDCPLRFPGQYRDEETGWHYNLHRYYVPDTASYASPDPLGLDAAPNHHAYIDNPLVMSDPLGLNPANCPTFAGQDPVTQAARQGADGFSTLSNKQRPGVSEAIGVTDANGTQHIYAAGSGRDTPNLHQDVQNVLDGVPEAQRGVNHGRCGLPRALTQSLDAGHDPTGADAAAVLVRKDMNSADHNRGIGPCQSCRVLTNHYGLNFITDDGA